MDRKKCGGFRSIAGWVVSLLTITVLLTACSGSSDDSESGQEQFLQENSVTEEQEKETDTNTDGAAMQQDGVADGYKMMSVQAPVDQIIADYHEKGYDYVWLISHEVKKEEGDIGDVGTADTVNLQATYIDVNGTYQITEEIGTVYAYWGEEIGWKNSFDVGTLVEYDVTGFNNTYWKLVDDNNGWYEGYGYDIASAMIGNDIMNQYDMESAVSVYFTFTNFETFTVEIEDVNYFKNLRFYKDISDQRTIGTVTVVVEGDVYSNSLQLKNISGASYYQRITIPDGVIFCFQDENSQYDACDITYSTNGYTGIDFISEEEYGAALQGQVQEIETSTSERESGEDTYNAGNEFDMARVNDTYYINGTDEGCYEIYFYVEDGAILFSVYRDGIDLIRQADAVIVDGKTLHFDGYDDWNIDFVWNEETSFWVDGAGDEIADMIGTEFFNM